MPELAARKPWLGWQHATISLIAWLLCSCMQSWMQPELTMQS